MTELRLVTPPPDTLRVLPNMYGEAWVNRSDLIKFFKLAARNQEAKNDVVADIVAQAFHSAAAIVERMGEDWDAA